jgi:transcriptional regulator with XRE-family HTH domain
VSRVGDNIKKLRTEAGMSLKQLAKKLGVAENFINEVENGRKVVNEEVINRISKILGKDINDIGMSVEEQSTLEVHQDVKSAPVKREVKTAKTEAVQEIWSSAFGSVLKEVPVYDYDMKKVFATRLLPLQGNKIEGYAQDKVFFLTIADDDMLGFRMAKGDIAFAHQVMEIENNAVYLLQYNSDRVVRQIKKLDGNKLLLISNKGSLRTETVTIKDIKIIAKLDRVEIKL